VRLQEQENGSHLRPPAADETGMASLSSTPTEYTPAPARTPDRDLSTATQVLLGPSPAMTALWARLHRVAPYFRTVLLTGEPGCGQEAAARALHELSPLRTRPFVSLNEADAEAHLAQESGPQAAPAWGTLYLAQPERLSRAAQAGLLRLLQHRGSPAPRVVTCAEHGLRPLTGASGFSSELANALGALQMELPPLRKRSEDIPSLVAHMLRQHAGRLAVDGQPVEIPALAADFLPTAARIPWLGNLDQMDAALGWLLIHGGDTLHGEDLYTALTAVEQTSSTDAPPVRLVPLDQIIREQVHAVLLACNGNKLRAAEILGISRSTLYRMLSASGTGCGVPGPA
jgi:DNA-binding NtrC family response regulator